MNLNKYCSLAALCLLVTSNASALTLYSFTSQGNAFGSSSSWDQAATITLTDGNTQQGPYLFSDSLVTLGDTGQELLFRATESDADFAHFASVLTNGIDDRLTISVNWNGSVSGSASVTSTFESNLFDGSAFTNGVDFIGATITAIELRVFDISAGPIDFENGFGLSYELTIEGEPVPLPAAGWLFLSGIAMLSRWRKRTG